MLEELKELVRELPSEEYLDKLIAATAAWTQIKDDMSDDDFCLPTDEDLERVEQIYQTMEDLYIPTDKDLERADEIYQTLEDLYIPTENDLERVDEIYQVMEDLYIPTENDLARAKRLAKTMEGIKQLPDDDY